MTPPGEGSLPPSFRPGSGRDGSAGTRRPLPPVETESASRLGRSPASSHRQPRSAPAGDVARPGPSATPRPRTGRGDRGGRTVESGQTHTGQAGSAMPPTRRAPGRRSPRSDVPLRELPVDERPRVLPEHRPAVRRSVLPTGDMSSPQRRPYAARPDVSDGSIHAGQRRSLSAGGGRGTPATGERVSGSSVSRPNGGYSRSYARSGSSVVPLGQSSPQTERTRAVPDRASAPALYAPRPSDGTGQSHGDSDRQWRPIPGQARRQQPGETDSPWQVTDSSQDPHQPVPGSGGAHGRGRRRRRHRVRTVISALVAVMLVAVALAGWRMWSLARQVDEKIGRVEGLELTQDTSDGETWLVVGSDARGAGSGSVQDATEGARSDAIMVVNKAPDGQESVVSIPRDTFVQIPGFGGNKINASYAYGGPALLVQTVEGLTGLTVDHYAEVGMGAVESLVDAVGGVNVCLDYDVDDRDSGLVWDTSQGTCQDVDGRKALAYSRMRKSDPTGDIGRGLRQRAVVSAVVSKAASMSTLTSPSRQDALVEAGTDVMAVDPNAGVTDLAKMALVYRAAGKAGLTGAPPIESLDYEPGGIGAAVLLRDTTAPEFFQRLKAGTLTPADFQQAR